jgi:hypothetical protein
MLALGLGFFLVRSVMDTPANGSEENENDFRLFTRSPRRCRTTVYPLRLKVLAMIFAIFKHRNMPSRHPAVRAF